MKKYVCIHINTAIRVLFHLCQEKRKAIGGIVFFFCIKKDAKE